MLKAKTIKILIQKIFLLLYKKLIFFNKKIKYTTKIGVNIYVMVETWINIAFAILIVSCFTKNLESDHFSTIN